MESSSSLVGSASELFAGVEQVLGFWSAVFSLSISMIGTGVVAFPYGLAVSGYIAGPLFLLVIVTLAYFSFVSLINSTKNAKTSSWGKLLQNLSPAWEKYGNISLVVLLILAVSAYIVIAANVVQAVASGRNVPKFILRHEVLSAIMLAIMLPFVLAKSLQGLSKLANVCTLALFVVVLGVVYQCCRIVSQDPPAPHDAPSVQMLSPLNAIPIFACAVFGHMNIPQIYAELKPDLKPKAHRVVLVALTGSTMVYLAIGIAGYLAFGRVTASDVVKQIADHEGHTAVVGIIQACLASFIILKCPLLVLPARSVILVLFGRDPSHSSTQVHVTVTLGILALVYVFAIALPTLNLILEVLGAIAVIPMCFIIPARLSWSLEMPRRTGVCILMTSFGILTSVLSLITAIHDIISSK